MLYISGTVPDGTITTAKLAAGAVTAAKIAAHVIGDAQITANGITSASLSNTGVSAAAYKGTDLTVDAAGRLTVAASGAGNATSTTVAAPTGIVTGATRMLGLAAPITPVKSGKVQIVVSGAHSNGSGTDTLQIAYGTGSAPANAAAATGTTVGGAPVLNTDQAALAVDGFCLTAVVSGLTLSTAYWVDLQVNAAAGTATLTGVTVTLEEV